MAAPCCNACLTEIKNKKSYRKVNNADFSSVFETIGIHSFNAVCYPCFNKLNRFKNLEKEAEQKLAGLKASKDELSQSILGLAGVTRVHTATPVSRKKKRPVGTPTGLTPKPKRVLFSSPKPKVIQKPKHIQLVDKATQTANQTDDFSVKVTVKYAGHERSKIISDSTQQAVVKSFLNNASHTTVTKHLVKCDKFKSAMVSAIGSAVKNEVNTVCKMRESLLKTTSTEDLIHFDWKDTIRNMNIKLPSLMGVLAFLGERKQKDNIAQLVTAVSVLLYIRNHNNNLLQSILGIVLDNCGLRKEGLSILHHIGLCVSYTSVHRKKKDLCSTQKNNVKKLVEEYKTSSKISDSRTLHIDQNSNVADTTAAVTGTDTHDTDSNQTLRNLTSETEAPTTDKTRRIEVLGDNLDLTISPACMTMERQRKSLHWFLLMVKRNRVSYEDVNMPKCQTQPNILDLGTHMWIPDASQRLQIKQNFIFHVSKVLLRYIKDLESINYPDCIEHEYIHLTREKSIVLNCDIINESENSSQGMIRILQKVHEIVVPHVDKTITDRVVFGGDVLTNERAFSAQSAMQNNSTDLDSLTGIVHRPEGLHREFNFLTAIYQLFYKESSATDRGSLYHLRNIINRRDVTGHKEVKEKFRPHSLFIEDVTDAYIVSTFLDMMDMKDLDSKPRNIPVMSLLTDEQKIQWIDNVSERVIDQLNIVDNPVYEKLYQDLRLLNNDDTHMEEMKIDGIYLCPLCTKTYTHISWFKKHLEKVHKWKFHQPQKESNDSSPISSFLFMSLLYRDTCDAYKLGDGDRIVRNAYFEWLFDSALGHTKYKLWLWRMISYCISILGTEQSFEYKWNMCVNLKGGVENNIPNDNGVELQVKNIKTHLNTQGVNKTFESAKKVCMTTQVVDNITENLIKKTKSVKSSRIRPAVDKSKDISIMVNCLRSQGPLLNMEWKSFKSFKNPIQKIDAEQLHLWVKNQKVIADVYL